MKSAIPTAVILLAAVALAHLLRLIFGVQVMVGDTLIPLWVSGVAFLVASGVAFMLWRAGRGRG
jgi:membrane protein implicated in regulation of membrane protease activity